MTWKLGRCGTDVTLGDPSTWDANGDRASISGYLNAATQADVNVLREQLLGYADNPDEEIVPVTWTVDSRVDGFYRVLSVRVSEDPSWRTALTLPYRLELERVPGFAAPLFEAVVLGALRTNAHSITTGQPWHAVPVDSAQRYTLPGLTITSVLDRAGADGAIYFYAAGATGYHDAKPRFYVPPAAGLQNAAKIEVQQGGNYRTVVGRQILNTPNSCRLSNGLVRVTPVSNTTSILFDVQHFTGGVWESLKRYRVLPAFAESGTLNAHGLTVLRNAPEEAIIRVTYSFEGTPTPDPIPFEITIDFALRRGARTVNLFLASKEANTFGLRRDTAEAGTAITGGIEATAVDADGNKYMIVSSKAMTADTTNGGLQSASNISTVDFGVALSGTARTEDQTSSALGLRTQYFSVQSEHAVVAAR